MKTLLFISCFLSCILVSAQPIVSGLVTNTEPDRIRFITSDVDAFWKAFDLFKRDTTTNPFEDYLTKGTPAIQQFLPYRIKDAHQFKKMIKNEIRYYESIRPYSKEILTYEEQVREYFTRFKRLYPHAIFPDVYFVIGQMNTGGTIFDGGIIIGMEQFAADSLTTSYGQPAMSIAKLPFVITSALIFYQQKPAHTGYTLLRQCIIQGSADFVTSLVLDEDKDILLNSKNYQYGEQHEEALMKEFLREKDSSDFSKWLYQGQLIGERPADLGYWVGYKITEAYYNNATNKTRAIDEIFKINDFEKFLLLSGYAEPFRN